MKAGDKLIVQMLSRLFWLVTQASGHTRYASDVALFTNAEVAAGLRDRESADRIIKGYQDEERARES